MSGDDNCVAATDEGVTDVVVEVVVEDITEAEVLGKAIKVF